MGASFGNFTTPYVISYTSPSSGTYTFNVDFAPDSGFLYQVSSGTTALTFDNDRTTRIDSGQQIYIESGSTLYLMPLSGSSTSILHLNVDLYQP
jgi:hypothetical protein